MSPASQRASIAALIVGLAVAVAGTGCAGGRGSVRAEATRIPISFSSSLPDSMGRIHRLGESLAPVGRFVHTANAIGFIYSATPMDVDISLPVEQQVRAVGGHGIVNLSVGVGHCPLNFFFPFNHIPLWPGCARFRFDGVIVRRVRP